jgi:hypothetical protein
VQRKEKVDLLRKLIVFFVSFDFHFRVTCCYASAVQPAVLKKKLTVQAAAMPQRRNKAGTSSCRANWDLTAHLIEAEAGLFCWLVKAGLRHDAAVQRHHHHRS